MNIAELTIVFVLTWWLVFLGALPVGVRRDETPEEGNDPGAPTAPKVTVKALIATLIAAILTSVFYWIGVKSGFSLRELYNR